MQYVYENKTYRTGEWFVGPLLPHIVVTTGDPRPGAKRSLALIEVTPGGRVPRMISARAQWCKRIVSEYRKIYVSTGTSKYRCPYHRAHAVLHALASLLNATPTK